LLDQRQELVITSLLEHIGQWKDVVEEFDGRDDDDGRLEDSISTGEQNIKNSESQQMLNYDLQEIREMVNRMADAWDLADQEENINVSEKLPLPAGWTVQTAPNGRVFFMDLNSKRTTWLHPISGRPSPPSHTFSQTDPLPAGWTTGTYSQGKMYFFNHKSKEKTSIDPRSALMPNNQSSLPDGWSRRIHKDGRPYFINYLSKTTQWEDPRNSTSHNVSIHNVYNLEETSEKICRMNMVALIGPPGTGKTLVGLELTRQLSRKAANPLVIITPGNPLGAADPLMASLKERAEDWAKVESWHILLQTYGIETTPDSQLYQYPEVLLRLCQALEQSHPDKDIVLMVDELSGVSTVTSQDPSGNLCHDWRVLKHLGNRTTLVAIFNPGLMPYNLLMPPSCYKIDLEMTYRSSQRISSLHSSLLNAKRYISMPSHPATEVVGSTPLLIDIGNIDKFQDDLMPVLKEVAGWIGVEKEVTLLYDVGVTTIANVQAVVKSQGWNWNVLKSNTFTGWEANFVISLGEGFYETISRARIKLAIVRCWDSRATQKGYENRTEAYQYAIENGLVEVRDVENIK
jgi:uncharacterized protein YbdZ (MbtH family)